MAHYIGILDGDDGVWGVRIPDLPGCFGGGGTPEAAITDAISAASEWAKIILNDTAELPRARTLSEILATGEIDIAAGESSVIIPLVVDSGRPVRANLSIDGGLLATIDAEARRRGQTRSAFIASAAREKIEAQR